MRALVACAQARLGGMLKLSGTSLMLDATEICQWAG